MSITEFAYATAVLFFESPSDGTMRFDSHKIPIDFLEIDETQTELQRLREVVVARGQRFRFEHYGETFWTFLIEFIARFDELTQPALCVDGLGDMPTDEWASIEQFSDYVSEQISRSERLQSKQRIDRRELTR